MYLTIPEKMEIIEETFSIEEKKNLLIKYTNEYQQIKEYLRIAFDPAYEFDLPEGDPLYKVNPNPIEYAGSNLIKEQRKLVNVLPGNTVDSHRREIIFIQILESLSAIEAQFLLDVKNKTVFERYPSITPELINEVFPDLIVSKIKDDVKVVTGEIIVPIEELKDSFRKPVKPLYDLDEEFDPVSFPENREIFEVGTNGQLVPISAQEQAPLDWKVGKPTEQVTTQVTEQVKRKPGRPKKSVL